MVQQLISILPDYRETVVVDVFKLEFSQVCRAADLQGTVVIEIFGKEGLR